MPPLVIAAAIAGGAQVAGNVIGSRSASRSADRAARSDSAALDQQMALERQRDDEARRQFDAQQQFDAQKWAVTEEQRIYDRRLTEEREARRAPYRAASGAALGRLGDLLGLSFDSGVRPPSTPPAGAGAPMAMPMRRPESGGMASGPDTGAWGMPGGRMAATDPAYAEVNAPGTLGALVKMTPRRRMAPRY